MVGVMFRAEECFVCAWELKGTEPVAAQARTAETAWREVALCGICAGKMRREGGTLIYKGDEWVTVRVRNGKDEPVTKEEQTVM